VAWRRTGFRSSRHLLPFPSQPYGFDCAASVSKYEAKVREVQGEVTMRNQNRNSSRQLRFSMPWRGTGTRCTGCKYLSEAGAGFWQCKACWDGFCVVSEGALCLAQQRRFLSREAQCEGTELSDEDADFTIAADDCTGDQFCPRCGEVLVKHGCWVCRCGYRECG
jgi:hypothetical protein